jgi:hypothetical protein
MIPVSSKGYVEHTDIDGVVWKFKPKAGDTEDQLITFFDNKETTHTGLVKTGRDLIDYILIGWSDPLKKGMPEYPKDKKPSLLFTAEERNQIISFWYAANALSTEEKKI